MSWTTKEYSSVALYSGSHSLSENLGDYRYVLVASNPGTWFAD
jgi:hypothetical protein